jgi:Trk-type K+ transport system membrane component
VTPDARQDEVTRILAFTREDPERAYGVVERQLSVLVLRTQVMLSLSGIVITVTGFSGRAIAQTNDLARVLVAVGILVVLAAAATAIGGVLRLRWLTQELGDDLRATLTRMLEIRDTKSRYLSAALLLFIVGFSCYCVAIAQMLLHVEPGR